MYVQRKTMLVYIVAALALIGVVVTVTLWATHAAGNETSAGASDRPHDEQAYLQNMEEAGYPLDNPDAAIRSAKGVCTVLYEGTTTSNMITWLKELEYEENLDYQSLVEISGIAVKAFCPEYLDVVPGN